jgi:hypothetical protein
MQFDFDAPLLVAEEKEQPQYEMDDFLSMFTSGSSHISGCCGMPWALSEAFCVPFGQHKPLPRTNMTYNPFPMPLPRTLIEIKVCHSDSFRLLEVGRHLTMPWLSFV